MTLEQLRIFVGVAEREHVTRAAEVLNVTQSAASAAIAALEALYGVALFHRVGRGIELTEAGRVLLEEARAVLARAAQAERALAELAGLSRGTLKLVASQTIASYWLPSAIADFHARHPAIELALSIANTEAAGASVRDGSAELGFVEGHIDDPALARWQVGQDQMLLISADPIPGIDKEWLAGARWVLREQGSGTRSTMEALLADRGLAATDFEVALTLPSNEAVRTAVEAGAGVTLLSALVAALSIEAGKLHGRPLDAVQRPFFALRHKERYRSKAADAFLDLLGEKAA